MRHPLNGESTVVADETVELTRLTAEETVAEPPDEDVEYNEREQQFQKIKSDVHRQVIGKIDLSLIGTMNEGDLRFEIRRASEKILEERSYLLNVEDRERLVNEVIDETFGLGPLEPLFRDPTITDILINGAKTVYIERRGRLEKSRISFANDAHLTKIVQRIVSAVGRRIDETTPMVDARLAGR